jgi:hypothetical protein
LSSWRLLEEEVCWIQFESGYDSLVNTVVSVEVAFGVGFSATMTGTVTVVTNAIDIKMAAVVQSRQAVFDDFAALPAASAPLR